MDDVNHKHYVFQLFSELKRLGVFKQYINNRLHMKHAIMIKTEDGESFNLVGVNSEASYEELIKNLELCSEYFTAKRPSFERMPLIRYFNTTLVSFNWLETKEGVAFWSLIYEKLKKLEHKYA